MPRPPTSADVVACDHFLPVGKKGLLLYEFHVVVQLEGARRRVRLRTDRCEPIKLMHMLPLTTVNPTREDVDDVADMFRLGQRIQFHYWSILTCLQRPEYGFDPMDVAVQPSAIELLRGPAPRTPLGLIEGGVTALRVVRA